MKSFSIFILSILFTAQVFAQKDSIAPEFNNIYDVIPLNINSSMNEMTPYVIGKTIYFSGNSKKNLGVRYNEDGDEPLYDIYTASAIDSIHFASPTCYRGFSSLFNDGPLSFDDMQTEALITTNQHNYNFVLNNYKEAQDLKIYYSDNKNGKWSSPQIHPVCQGRGSFCHAVFCKDKNTMIFASDIPGGYGGMDLYITKRINNEWSKPVNLGVNINSSSNEVFPFVNKSGIFYFSSDRPGGKGGLDIYTILLKDTISDTAVSLETPVNSTADDFGVWTDSTGNTGYLSSNRLNAKDDNLFYFYKILPEFEKEVNPQTKFCYTFFEEASVNNADTNGLQYEWDFSGEKYKGLEVKHCFDKPGTYPVQLNIIDKSSGELFYNDLSYDFVVEEPKQLKIKCEDTISIGSPLLFDASASQMEGYTINKYYWSFNDGWYSLGLRARHKYFKTGIQSVRLGVVARCDSTGKETTFYVDKKIYVGEKKKDTGLNIPGVQDWSGFDLNEKEKGTEEEKRSQEYILSPLNFKMYS